MVTWWSASSPGGYLMVCLVTWWSSDGLPRHHVHRDTVRGVRRVGTRTAGVQTDRLWTDRHAGFHHVPPDRHEHRQVSGRFTVLSRLQLITARPVHFDNVRDYFTSMQN